MKEISRLSDEMLAGVAGGNRIDDEAAASAAAAISSIGSDIAARIIATNEALNARQEVRFTIQEPILRGTEVYITDDGKQINISFVAASQECMEILRQHAGSLREQLKRAVPQDCNIIF